MLTIKEYKAAFNAKAIEDPTKRFKRTVIRETLAYTRTVAKNSMIDTQVGNDAKRMSRRDRRINKAGFIISGGEKVSRPGNPAFSKMGLVKQHIYYVAGDEDGVCGPAKLAGVKSKDAIEKLEYGGIETITVRQWVRGQLTQRSVSAQYRERPTMRLALAKAIEKKMPRLLAAGIMREV